jgi:hypothetical protein
MNSIKIFLYIFKYFYNQNARIINKTYLRKEIKIIYYKRRPRLILE